MTGFSLVSSAMRVSSRSLLLVATMALVVGCGATKPSPGPEPLEYNPETELDHMLCYEAASEPGFTAPGVVLFDQFEIKDDKPAVGKRTLLCNPVEKNRTNHKTKWLHEHAHLVCYNIPTSAFEKAVIITNQFDEKPGRTVQIKSAYVLCLPTGKSKDVEKQPEIPAAKDLDHFKCYNLDSDRFPLAEKLKLRDQFVKGLFDVGGRAALCNPVDKTALPKKPDEKEQKFPRQHRDAHLVCYAVKPDGDAKVPPQTVRIHNQFEDSVITTGALKYLCVPSTKKG